MQQARSNTLRSTTIATEDTQQQFQNHRQALPLQDVREVAPNTQIIAPQYVFCLTLNVLFGLISYY